MINLIFLLISLLLGNLAQAGNGGALIIGDSHSHMAFGQTLEQLLGPDAKRHAVSSTTTIDWLKPAICPSEGDCEFKYGYSSPDGDFEGAVPPGFPGIDALLKKYSPAKVIVALGTNDAYHRCKSSPEEAMGPFREMAKRLKHYGCTWVGPPAYKVGDIAESCGSPENYDRFVSNIKQTVIAEGCRFIDSREIRDPTTGKILESDHEDQVHFSPASGRKWGEAVANQVKQKMATVRSPERAEQNPMENRDTYTYGAVAAGAAGPAVVPQPENTEAAPAAAEFAPDSEE